VRKNSISAYRAAVELRIFAAGALRWPSWLSRR
jgi:hypothetical protein